MGDAAKAVNKCTAVSAMIVIKVLLLVGSLPLLMLGAWRIWKVLIQ